MADERRSNNEQILLHMGEVKQFMKQDATWKREFVDKKLNGRLIKVETKQSLVTWIGGALGLTFIYTFFRDYLPFFKHPPG